MAEEDVTVRKYNSNGTMLIERPDGRVGIYNPKTQSFTPDGETMAQAAEAVATKTPPPSFASNAMELAGRGLTAINPAAHVLGLTNPTPAEARATAGSVGRVAVQAGLGAVTGGLPGAVLGGAGEAVSQMFGGPQESSEGLGIAAGATAADMFSSMVLGKFKGPASVLKAGARAAGIRGGSTFLMTLGEKHIEDAVRRELGTEIPTEGGGSIWMAPAALGIFSGIAGGGTAALSKHFDNIQSSNLTTALNRLSKNPETRDIDIGAALPEAMDSKFLRGFAGDKEVSLKASSALNQYINEQLPSELTPRSILGTMQAFKNIWKTYKGELTGVSDTGEKIRAALTKREIKFAQGFINVNHREAENVMATLHKSDDTLTMLGIMKKIARVTGDGDDLGRVEELTNEWIRRELIGNAVDIIPEAASGFSVPGASGGVLKGVVSGEALLKRLQEIGPEKIDDVLGPGRSQALEDFAVTLKFMNPEGMMKGSGPDRALGSMFEYNAKKQVFTFSQAGLGTAALAAFTTLPTAAATAAGIWGLAKGLQLVVNHPQAAKLFVSAAKGDHTAGEAFVRALISGRVGTTPDNELLPPNARESR